MAFWSNDAITLNTWFCTLSCRFTNIIPDTWTDTSWFCILILLFLIGETPKPSKDTQQNLPCGTDIRSMLWSATITNTEETNLRVKIQTGCDAIIGKWKFSVSSTYQFTICGVIDTSWFSFMVGIKWKHSMLSCRIGWSHGQLWGGSRPPWTKTKNLPIWAWPADICYI